MDQHYTSLGNIDSSAAMQTCFDCLLKIEMEPPTGKHNYTNNITVIRSWIVECAKRCMLDDMQIGGTHFKKRMEAHLKKEDDGIADPAQYASDIWDKIKEGDCCGDGFDEYPQVPINKKGS